MHGPTAIFWANLTPFSPKAWVHFLVDEVRGGQSDTTVTVNIYGEKNANAAAPTLNAKDLSSRAITDAAVVWQPETSLNVMDSLDTPDIGDVVREIVGMSGWGLGNSICILFGHIEGAGVRWVESSSEEDGIMTPSLYIQGAAGGCAGPPQGVASIENLMSGGEEDVGGDTDGQMYLDSSDYELMHDGDGQQVVGITFPSVGIAAGTDLSEAHILFVVDEVREKVTDEVTISIYGEANANSAAPTLTTKDLSSRTPTTASVTWQPEASVAVNDPLNTPDISSILMEIIALPGWASGNPMTILFGHTSGAGVRWVESSATLNDVLTPALFWTEGSAAGCGGCQTIDGVAPISDILAGGEEDVGGDTDGQMYLDSSDYELMHDGDGEQLVGITFASVTIAKGATVISANVMFLVDEIRPGRSDGDVTVAIYGEAIANSDTPKLTAKDLSSRTPTAAGIIWRPEKSVAVMDTLLTPDIGIIVSEIVNLDGWSSGNAMTILFGHVDGSGTRWVESAAESSGMMTPALLFKTADAGCSFANGISGVADLMSGGEEDVGGDTDGQMYLDSSDYELMHDGGEQVVGIVFPNVDISADAILSSANVLFIVDEVRDESNLDVTIAIYGEANTSPAAPTLSAKDLSSRLPTSHSVMWRPEFAVAVGDMMQTPNIASIVTEIVGMDGWQAGNSMCILFAHTEGAGVRWVESYATIPGSDVASPALQYSYAVAGGGSASTSAQFSVASLLDGGEEDVGGDTDGQMYLDSSDYELMHDGAGEQVRKTPSWPRSWANFSLLWLYSYWKAWANLYLLGQPNTFLAAGRRDRLPERGGAAGVGRHGRSRALHCGRGPR
jgi:hypothetical protein